MSPVTFRQSAIKPIWNCQVDLIAGVPGLTVIFQSSDLRSTPTSRISLSIRNSPSIIRTLTDRSSSSIVPNPEAAEKKLLNGLSVN